MKGVLSASKEKPVVRVEGRSTVQERLQTAASQAVRMPPDAPDESLAT